MSISSTTDNVAIIAQINSYIAQCGGTYAAWYCGIACDPRSRLFREHGVNQFLEAWIYRDAGNEQAARWIEWQFLSRGCKGGGSGGDCNTRFVYAYRIGPTTRD